MSDLVRTFVAVPVVATPQLRELGARLRALGAPVRCASLDQLHVTLKFLGSTPSDRIREILAVLHECAKSERAGSLQIRTLGAFPSRTRPRVLWAGVHPEEILARLVARLEAGLERLGYPPGQRGFKPHLTLARIAGQAPLDSLWETDGEAEFGETPLDHLVLYRSDLGDGSPRHIPLGSHRLSS